MIRTLLYFKEVNGLINNEYVNIEVTKDNLRYMRRSYKQCNIGDVLKIHYKDLGKNSRKQIELKCDYCGKIFHREIQVYNRKFDGVIEGQKDACDECKLEKMKETNLNKYGQEWYTQTEIARINLSENKSMYAKEIVKKAKKTLNEKFGVDNVFQLEEVKNKSKETIKKKYGVDHIMHLDKIKKIVNEKRLITLYKNGTAPSSKQQIYLHELLGGELNYPVSNCSLDIAFPDEMIYIEYNGGGHDLKVKMGQLTAEQFKNQENKRYFYLKSLGWKQICINCPDDILPPTDEIIKIIEDAKIGLFNSYHQIVNF